MQKIDLHTHLNKKENNIQILNVFAQDLPLLKDENYYSAGLHPWHLLRVNPEQCLMKLALAAGNKNLLAIGECGLDRSVKINFDTQTACFRKQIELAEQYSKPLIIHCVRAFPEVIQLKKEYRSTVPWILHGYQGNEATTSQFIRHDFYFSIGESLLTSIPKKEIIQQIPLDHLFLETDDRDISIEEIYSLAAQLLKIDEETLISLLYENFKRVFGRPAIL